MDKTGKDKKKNTKVTKKTGAGVKKNRLYA